MKDLADDLYGMLVVSIVITRGDETHRISKNTVVARIPCLRGDAAERLAEFTRFNSGLNFNGRFDYASESIY